MDERVEAYMTDGDRPELNKSLDAESFRQWYWLKDELVQFCRENSIPTSGGKTALSERISHFLATGEIRDGSTQTKGNGKSKPLSARMTAI